jgi:acetyltransferase-like isoleucine patch superfamily enzyme
MEIQSWGLHILRWLPGGIGSRLRYYYYRRILSDCGERVSFPIAVFMRECRNISIGTDVGLGLFSQLYAAGGGAERIRIGNHVSLNSNVMLNADLGGSITIGNDCIIGPNVVFRTSDHDFSRRDIPIKDQGHIAGIITVKNNVWIGANVSVIGTVTIGEGAVIGAGSVVNRDIEDYAIAAGVPARKISSR